MNILEYPPTPPRGRSAADMPTAYRRGKTIFSIALWASGQAAIRIKVVLWEIAGNS